MAPRLNLRRSAPKTTIVDRSFWCGMALSVSVFAQNTSAAPLMTRRAAAERGRAYGPSTVMATADLKTATALQGAAGLPPLTNPYLELFVDRSKETQGAAVQANLWLPIELAGQRAKRLDEVDRLVAWRKAAKVAAASLAEGEAVGAWGELAVALARRKDAADGAATAQAESAYVKARFQLNDGTALDVALAEGEVARWVQAGAEANVAVATATARFGVAIGEPLTESLDDMVFESLPSLPWKDEKALVAHLESVSPLLAAAEEEVRFFTASRERWDVEKYAPVNLILSVGRTDLGNVSFGAGLAWSLPLLRKNQTDVARADAEADRARAAKVLALTTLRARARGAFAAYQAVRSALDTLETIAVPAAKTVVDLSVAAWKKGQLEATKVFQARRDLATARARRLDLSAMGWRALGDLAALGAGVP